MRLKKLAIVLSAALYVAGSSEAWADRNQDFGSHDYGNPSHVGQWSKSVWENAYADFNGDGNIDFISAVTKNHAGGPALKVFCAGDGNGKFECNAILPSTECYSVDAADYNKDGFIDLAIGNKGQNYLLVNDGKGKFTTIEQFGKGSTMKVAWCDCNADGLPDLAVANRIEDGGNGAQNFLYINQGNGAFKKLLEFGDQGSYYISWGDCNNDGRPDAAVANQRGLNALYLNTGENHFKAVQMFGKGPTTQIIWADYNKDGKMDAVAVNGIFSQEAIMQGKSDCNMQNMLFTNKGEGGFETTAAFGAGCSQSASWGDFNQDGALDLIISNADKHHLPRLYVNNGEGIFSEDLNNLPNFPDQRIGLWGARGTFQDINGDKVPEYLLAQY